MTTIEKLTLIDGQFTYEESKEILFTMLSAKIDFHNMRNWSSQERFGKCDALSQERLPALLKEREKLEWLLSEAKAQDKNLVVNAEITVKLVAK